jgi:hypothetical protein
MDGTQSEVLAAILEIRDMVRLMAEPAIAARDQQMRAELRSIVGSSISKGKSVQLMDGSRTQTEIHHETLMNKGNLSTLVKQLAEAKLLLGDGKKPKLSISIPPNFFETGIRDE